MSVVLPAPVGPTSAMVCPALASSVMFLMTGLVRQVAEADVRRSAPLLEREQAAGQSAASSTSAGVSIISKTRSAPASAAWIELYMFAS